ncbi:peptidase inhibitor R3HDML-like [Asterias amurensis]|uniref:peptidase inhibitor R3HDML-like n=1 Tax=Asterias amurensis TaxID=7602 RepID=UPI003AB4A20A
MMNRSGMLLVVVLVVWMHTASAGLTRKQEKVILDQHNKFRSKEKGASNMMKLVWSKELARKAQGWADRCIMDHNPEKSSSKWSWVGENMAFASYRNPLDMVSMWEGEKAIFNHKSNRCNPDPSDPLLSSCGHYTQMIWGDTQEVGCGFKTNCPNSGMPSRLVCNYGEGGNWRGEKPYSTGKKCSDCPPQFKKCSGGLCSK